MGLLLITAGILAVVWIFGKQKLLKTAAAALSVFAVCLCAACQVQGYVPEEQEAVSEAETETSAEETLEEAETAEEETEFVRKESPFKNKRKKKSGDQIVTLVAIGDMLMHPGVSGYAFQADGSIDYSYLFDPIREEVEAADIAVVNNEVPFGGDQYGLQNYPNFNVFTNLGDAEIEAGFDVMLGATNHVMDMGASGTRNTINFWKKYPKAFLLGLHESHEDQQSLKIIERNGVKIALFNYTYGLNSFGLSASEPYLVDLMTPAYRDKIREELRRAEEEADFTIVFPHWGEEYQLKENGNQREWAQFFTENGADLIIGTHPHCLEPVESVTAENGNMSLCYYSLGNYISLQDETISMLGGLAEVTIVKGSDGVTEIMDHDLSYLVTQYDASVSWAYVRRLEDYSDTLAAQHGINTAHLPGNGNNPAGSLGLNAYYPLCMDTFRRVVNEINGGPRAALAVPIQLPAPLIEAPEEENGPTEKDTTEAEETTKSSANQTEADQETSRSEDRPGEHNNQEDETTEGPAASEPETTVPPTTVPPESSEPESEAPESSESAETETPTETPESTESTGGL